MCFSYCCVTLPPALKRLERNFVEKYMSPAGILKELLSVKGVCLCVFPQVKPWALGRLER